MVTITQQLDGRRLAPLALEGFPDETVLLLKVGDLLIECGFRAMETPSHTAPTDAPRAATMDEIAEVAHRLAGLALVGSPSSLMTDDCSLITSSTLNSLQN